MVDYRAKASIFRENAEEIRIRIETLLYDETKRVFLQLADDYERLADTYEAMAALDVSE